MFTHVASLVELPDITRVRPGPVAVAIRLGVAEEVVVVGLPAGEVVVVDDASRAAL